MARQPGGYGDYGAHAGGYDHGHIIYPSWVFELILEKVMGRYPYVAKVLDVGCGTGLQTSALFNIGYTNIIGADIDKRMIKVARSKDERTISSPIIYMVSSVADLGFADNSFDLITTFGGLSWFHDVPGSVENIRRMLRRGGWFFALDEHFQLPPRYQYVRTKYAPREATGDWPSHVDPRAVLGTHGFRQIQHFEETTSIEFDTFGAMRYVLAGSWQNFVEPWKKRFLRDEVFNLCKKEEDSKGKIHWPFRFSVTFGRK